MHLLIASYLFLYFPPVTAGEILTKKLEMDKGRSFSFILPYFDIPRYADKIMVNKCVFSSTNCNDSQWRSDGEKNCEADESLFWRQGEKPVTASMYYMYLLRYIHLIRYTVVHFILPNSHYRTLNLWRRKYVQFVCHDECIYWCTWLAIFPDFPLSPGIHFNPVLSVPSTCMDQLLHRCKI